MIQTKCINGHYFDCEEYQYCPVCGAVSIEKDKGADTGKKKLVNPFSFIKKEPAKKVKAEPMPDGRVDKTFGILNFGQNNQSTAEPVFTEESFSDYNDSRMNFDIDDEMYLESDPVVEDNHDRYEEFSRESYASMPPQPEPKPVPRGETSSQQGRLEQQFASAQAKTVGFFGASSASVPQSNAVAPNPRSSSAATGPVEPVVGWLVAIKGEHLGECFNIYSGKSSLGRSQNNRIILAKDLQISREKHAFIMYEPKKRQFFIQSGDSSGLTYLNDENIIGSHVINAFDILELGGSQFVFVPLCGDKFAWENYIGK